MELKEISIANIDTGERARDDMGNIEELTQSIVENGLINPIALFNKSSADNWDEHPLKAEEKYPEREYLLLAGGRRFLGFLKGKVGDKIPSRIYDEHLDADQIKLIELVENLHRKELSWQEEIELKAQIDEHYKNLHGEKRPGGSDGHSTRDTAKLLEESPSVTSEDINLYKAMQTVPELKKAKSKTDAKKTMKKLKKKIEDAESAEKLTKEREKKGDKQVQVEITKRFMVKEALQGMKELDEKVVDLVELDPPLKIGFEDIYEEGISYDASLDQDNYEEEMEEILRESFRIIKSNGWILVWYPIEPYHKTVAELMRKVGFKVREIPIVWNKKSGNTRSPNYNLANNYEVLLYGRKGKPILNKPGANNILSHSKPSPTLRYHDTEKPIELYMELFEIFLRKESNIAVGYAGSGNAILAAENVGMKAFGFDTSKDWKNKFDLKTLKGKPGEYTSYITHGGKKVVGR